MASFADQWNQEALSAAAGGADMSWDNFFKRKKIQELAESRKTSTKTAKPKKDFLTDQISTGGGILGSLAGGVGAGALAGSIVPGAGTAVGAGVGLLGAILGGALGSAGGEVAENAVTGEALDTNVGKEALFGGISSVGPIRGVNALVQGGKALASGVGKEGALEAVGQAATSTPIRDAIGRAAGSSSNSLAIKGLGLTPKTQLGQYQKMYGEDVGDLLKRNNLVGRTADDFGEPIAGLQGKFNDAVAGIPGVPRQTIAEALQGVYDPLKSSVSLSEQQLGKNLKSQADAIIKGTGENLTGPELNKLRQVFDSQVNYNNRVANPANYDVNKRTADALRGVVRDVAPETKDLGQELNKLRTVEEWAQDQANLGRGSRPFDLMTLLGAGAGGTVGGIPGALATGAVVKGLNSRPVSAGASKLLDKVSQRAGSGSGQANSMSPLAVGGRFAGMEAATGGLTAPQGVQAQAVDEAGLTEEDWQAFQQAVAAEGLDPSVAPGGGVAGAVAEAPQEAGNPFGVSLDEVGLKMREALASGDTKGYATLSDMYDRIYKFESDQASAGGGKKIAVEAQKITNNAQSGMQSLDDLESMITNDPNLVSRAALPDVSLLNSLTGTSEYRAAIKNVQDAMSRLRSGASMTEQESARFDKMLPRLGDDMKTVQYKIKQFRDYFGGAMQNASGSSGGGIEELLSQQGMV